MKITTNIRSNSLTTIALVGLAVLISPSVARADMVWPALFLTGRMWTWWAILIGLIVEYSLVRWKTSFDSTGAGQL